MVSNPRVKFYLTPAHDCSYFKDRQATTLFVDPRTTLETDLFAMLTENGFRRSGDYIYRPHCENCNACQSLRIPINRFSLSRNQKRIWKKNSSVEAKIIEPCFSEEFYALYKKYIDTRHRDGDMYPATETQFRSFLLVPVQTCRFIEFRIDGRLLAISVVDLLPKALSAIYTFYDPDYENLSPGSFAILWQIQFCQQENLDHLYLGYYIKDSSKMNYKSRFKPFQLYRNDYWQDSSG